MFRNDDDISTWNVSRLKAYLTEREIPLGNAKKEQLIELVHQCIATGLKPKDFNKCVDIDIYNKLFVENGLVRLPNPNTLNDWEIGPTSIPDITSDGVHAYYAKVNSNIGISTSGGQSLSLGKSLTISNHVSDIQYHGISHRIGYCFVKARVARQVHHTESPYLVWVILEKESGTPQSAYCNCPGG